MTFGVEDTVKDVCMASKLFKLQLSPNFIDGICLLYRDRPIVSKETDYTKHTRRYQQRKKCAEISECVQ